MFADAVGFLNNEIAVLRLSLKKLTQYSSTEYLRNLIKSKHPLMSLSRIKIALLNIGRNKVAQYLDTEVIDEIVTL